MKEFTCIMLLKRTIHKAASSHYSMKELFTTRYKKNRQGRTKRNISCAMKNTFINVVKRKYKRM